MEEHNGLQGHRLPPGPVQQEMSRGASRDRSAEEDVQISIQGQSSHQADSIIANGRETVGQEAPATSGNTRVEYRSLSLMERRRLWTSLSLLWWPGSTLLYSYRRRVFVVVSRYTLS